MIIQPSHNYVDKLMQVRGLRAAKAHLKANSLPEHDVALPDAGSLATPAPPHELYISKTQNEVLGLSELCIALVGPLCASRLRAVRC